MSHNDCPMCQLNEDLRIGADLLSEAVHASLFALVFKTEEAYEKERITKQAWVEFMNAHPQIELEEGDKNETS